jgi:hypothetical protein
LCKFTSLDFCSQGQVFYLKVCAEHYQHAANECLQLEGKDDDELVKLPGSVLHKL